MRKRTDSEKHRVKDAVSKHVWLAMGLIAVPCLIYPVIASYTPQVPLWRSLWEWFTKDKRRALDFVTIWAALSALLYAWVHHYLLEKHLDNLRQIEGSLSTRRTGQFPDYVNRIAKAAAETIQSFDIMADCVDYGSFFAPEIHRLAHDAICATASREGVVVRILVCGPPQPFTGTSRYSLANYLTNFKDIKRYAKRYLEIIRAEPGFIDWITELTISDSGDFQSLLKWLAYWRATDKQELVGWLNQCNNLCRGKKVLQRNENDRYVLETLLQVRQKWFDRRLRDSNVRIKYLKETHGLFLWIRDSKLIENRHALFAFPNPGRRDRQLGYQTHDLDLLESFQSIFDMKWGSVPSAPIAMKDQIVLRPATAEDEKFVNDLLFTTMCDYVEATWPNDPAAQHHYWEINGFDPSNTRILQVDGKDVGRLSTTLREDCVFIDELHILPEYQRRGIGRQAIEHVFKEARGKRLPIYATILKVNSPSKQLCLNMGFEVVGEKDQRWLIRYEK